MTRGLRTTGMLILISLCGATSAAHAIAPGECSEGGEFIRNAALARDAGITRQFFVDKMIEDLIVIRAYPPALRWFVQDEFDEKFLSDQVFKVFDEPVEAEEHEAFFISECLQVTDTALKARI
ncbi:MAG: hypothetical protein ABL878_13085 [Burkholderiales bacterium]